MYEEMSNAELIAEIGKAKADFHGAMGSVIVAEAVAKDEVAKRQALEEQLKRTEAIRDSYKEHRDKVQRFIQESIDREDWTAEELSEIFWEELAEILDLNLNLFEEKEITLTIEQAVTVRVKRGHEISGYDFDVNSQVDGLIDEIEVTDYGTAIVSDWSE